jgi:hypothetical protein
MEVKLHIVDVVTRCNVFNPLLFDCGSVSVWNLVSDIKGGTQTEGVWEQGVEEKYFDRREMKWREIGENFLMRSFVICNLRQIQLEW